MKTFADVKRKLVIGAKLKMVSNDWFPTGKLIGVTREITKVQSNGVYFGESFLDFVPAKQVEILSDNSFAVSIDPVANDKLVYEFVS